MDFEEIKNKLEGVIESFLDRIVINDIIGTSTQFDQTAITKDDVEKYLEENRDKLVQVRNAIMLNDINFYSTDANEKDPDRMPTNESEHVHLEKQKDEVVNFFETTVSKVCRKGENAYPMNSVFKSIIIRIDEKSKQLDFVKWFEKYPRTRDKGYYILLGNERFFFDEIKVDFVGYCADMIRHELLFRQELLQQLKNSLVNIFSEHLFLPDHEFLPKIKFSGDKVDISELIYALFISDSLENPENAKGILLQMFEISQSEYSKNVSYIRNKRNGKSKFLVELAKKLDQIK